jgi:hypothetical protein
MEREGEGSNVWWSMEGEGEAPFHLFSFSLEQIFIFSFDLKFLLFHGFRPLLTHFLPFP